MIRWFGLRYGFLVPRALALNHFVIEGLLGLTSAFQAAFFVLIILQPPFIIPLFMQVPAQKALIETPLRSDFKLSGQAADDQPSSNCRKHKKCELDKCLEQILFKLPYPVQMLQYRILDNVGY